MRLDSAGWAQLAPARNRAKATIWAGEWPPCSGIPAVIKDASRMPLPLRVCYGQRQLQREWRALQALAELPQTPAPLAFAGGCLVMQRLDGIPLNTLPHGRWHEEQARQLDDFVQAMHARGVTHGDLHRKNVLYDGQGRVFVIDWATAHVYGRGLKGWKKRSFDEFCALDRRAVAKIKWHVARPLLSQEERDLLVHGASPLYRAVKRVRLTVRRLLGRSERPTVDFSQ